MITYYIPIFIAICILVTVLYKSHEYIQFRNMQDKISNNLVDKNINDIYFQLEKQTEHLDNIRFNTSFIAIVIFLYILFKIICIIAGINLYNQL